MLNLELEKDSYLISTKENSDFKLIPAFGVVAGEFYPAGHAEMPEDEYVEDEAILEGLKGLLKFLKQYSNKSFKVELSRRWFKILSLHRIELPDNAEVILKD
jgi:7-cyano-7-deazaguanine tRNA-ribosyltransferase